MRQSKTILIVVLVIVLASIITASASLKQTQQSDRGKLPDGNWKVTFEPYKGRGYEQMPVQVISVGGYLTKSGVVFVKGLTLRNQSEKNVDKIHFFYYVYGEGKSDAVLAELQMDVFVIFDAPYHPDGILAKTDLPSKMEIGIPFSIGPKPLFGNLIKDKKLEGNYRIAVGINKVIFKDGSEWTMPENPWEKRVN